MGAPKVMLVAHHVGGVGGMEAQLVHMIHALLTAGYRVDVVSRRCELASRPGLRHHRVPGPFRPFPLGYLLFMAWATVTVARHRRGPVLATGALVLNRADVVTVHYLHRSAAQRSSARGSSSSPLRAASHRLGALLSSAAERWTYSPRRAGRVVAVSHGVADEIRAAFPAVRDRLTVIPNGVDRARFRPDAGARARCRRELGIAESTPMAVFVGGDWRRKGVDVAIEALALAPAWHLVVVGHGDPRPFQAIARTRDVGHRLHFAGARGDPAPFYAGADAFVLPSAYEAFPLVLLEAAAAGLPLVVTPVNGARELVQDGRNGWLIRRSPEAVAERLNQLGRLGAPERDAMRHAARASTEGLSWSGIGDRYVQLLRQVEVETP